MRFFVLPIYADWALDVAERAASRYEGTWFSYKDSPARRVHNMVYWFLGVVALPVLLPITAIQVFIYIPFITIRCIYYTVIGLITESQKDGR